MIRLAIALGVVVAIIYLTSGRYAFGGVQPDGVHVGGTGQN